MPGSTLAVHYNKCCLPTRQQRKNTCKGKYRKVSETQFGSCNPASNCSATELHQKIRLLGDSFFGTGPLCWSNCHLAKLTNVQTLAQLTVLSEHS